MDKIQREKLGAEFFPMLAGFKSEGMLLSKEEIKAWEKKEKLPKDIQDILVSDDIVEFIYKVGQKYNLTKQQIENFSKNVRKYFFNEITEAGFAQKISQSSIITLDDALKLLRVIKTIKPNKQNQIKNKQIKIKFSKALEKYPKILSQIITQKNIVTKPFLKPLKPTIKNWIMVYEKILGVSKHNTIERGEFVFRSEATKGLSEEDRERLLILFKARDEDNDIQIDSETGKMLFVKEEQVATQNQMNGKNSKVQHSQQSIQQKVNTPQTKKPTLGNIAYINKQQGFVNRTAQQGVDIQSRDEKKQEIQKQSQQPIKQNQLNNTQKTNPIQSKDIKREIEKNRIEIQQKKMEEKTWEKKPEIIKEPMRKQEEIGTPISQIKKPKDNSVKKPLAQKANKSIQQTKNKSQENLKGEISFSSNHVMPAEKIKKKATKKYSAFNMKPIGFVHSDKKPKKDNEEK